MPDSLQLWQNAARIQRTGDDASRLKCRLTGATFMRDIAGVQEKFDPFRVRSVYDIVHQAYEIEIRGNVRSGGFLRWLLESLGTAGAGERGLEEVVFRPDNGDLETFTIQFDGIEGVATFEDCALRRLAIDFRGRRKQTYSATFVALSMTRATPVWTGGTEEAGSILTTSEARASLSSSLGGDPDSHVVTVYEGTIELAIPGLAATQFNADGIPEEFARESNWDLTGRLLLPETVGITSDALVQEWNGEINFRCAADEGSVLEIEAGIVGQIERRTALGSGWKEAQFDFVSRRAPGSPIARVLTDWGEL